MIVLLCIYIRRPCDTFVKFSLFLIEPSNNNYRMRDDYVTVYVPSTIVLVDIVHLISRFRDVEMTKSMHAKQDMVSSLKK